MINKTRFFLYFFILQMVLTGFLQQRYDSRRNYFASHSVFVSLPSGSSLKILSFGFRNFLSDLLYIWSIQFYSTTTLENSYDYIEQVFNTITDITPGYKDPYIIGALIMVYDKGDVPMAIRLLDKGTRNNPAEWIFDHDAGYYAYRYLKDFKSAENYYSRAAQKPNAPSYIKRLKAHLVYLADNLQMAWQMWQEIYQQAKERLERDSAFNHLFQIKAELDARIIGERTRLFKERFGRYPRSLNELVQRGWIRQNPRDFSGAEYEYNPGTGQIRARQVFRWKKFS